MRFGSTPDVLELPTTCDLQMPSLPGASKIYVQGVSIDELFSRWWIVFCVMFVDGDVG